MNSIKKLKIGFSQFLTIKKGAAKTKKHKGVSLIETVITIMILALAISGAIYLMIIITESTNKNKNRITAIYLAQECTELTRNLRDSAWKQNLQWNCAFQDPTKTYRVSPDTTKIPIENITRETDCKSELGALIEEDDESDNFFQLQKENGRFSHEINSNSEKTKFHRKIKINKKNDHNITATCEVSWKNKLSAEKIEIETILTNWKKH